MRKILDVFREWRYNVGHPWESLPQTGENQIVFYFNGMEGRDMDADEVSWLD